MANSPALPLVIKVLDGPLATLSLLTGAAPGVVSLSGWSAPFRPMKHGGSEMRSKTSNYPGNPEGSQQVIGKKYKSTTMTGVWNDINLGNGAARALVDVFDAILGSGSTVQVTWGAAASADGSGAEGSDIVRIGLLVSFEPNWLNPRDVEWEATFDWRGRGDAFTPAVAAATVANPREGYQEAVGDLATASATTQTFLDRLASPVPQAARDALNAAVTDIDSATQAIQAVNSQVTELAQFPAGAARALVGAATLGAAAADQLEATFLSLDAGTTLLPTDAGIPLLLAKIRTFALLGATDDVKDSCGRAADGAAAQDEPDVLAEVTAPAGTDLRDLALKWYGDPDSWWAIADYNNLGTSEVPMPPTGPADHPPLTIRIPRLQGGPSSDLRQNC
jgi:hypothetical protein